MASKPRPETNSETITFSRVSEVDDVGDDDERVAAEDARHRALVLRLELVVELVADAAADLLGGRLDVEPRRDPLHQPQDHPEVLHVGPHRLGDARVLDLDRDVAPVVQLGAVDLADRGGRDRRLVELRERVLEASRRARTRRPCACRRSAPSAPRRAARRACAGTPRGTPPGTRPTSRNDITWPSFIAAPFIVPSAETICSAASTWRRSSAFCLPSSPRARLVVARAELARGLAGREAGHPSRARDA